MQQRVVSLLCFLVLSQLVLVPLANCRPASEEQATEQPEQAGEEQPEQAAGEEELPKQIR
jgi:hypothetical protein